MSTFGFDNINTVATEPKKNIDLSGLPKGVPAVSAEKDQRIIKQSEKLGFPSREPVRKASEERILRHNKKPRPPKLSLYITGPASVINRFIAFADKIGADSYWQAIEKLLNTAEERSRAGD
jgi:hypothetical protein